MCRSQDGGTGTHAVAHHAQTARVDGDIATAQFHTGQDLQCRLHIGGKTLMIRKHTVFSIRGGNGNAPAGQVPQRLVVMLDGFEPIVAEGDTGDAISLSRGVDLAGQSCIVKITNQHSVRSTLGKLCQVFVQIVSHSSKNSGKHAW